MLMKIKGENLPQNAKMTKVTICNKMQKLFCVVVNSVKIVCMRKPNSKRVDINTKIVKKKQEMSIYVSYM